MLCLLNLRVLLNSYIPKQVVPEKTKVIFQTLLALLGKEQLAKEPILD